MTPACARLCLPVLAAQMLRDGCIDPRATYPAPASLTLHDDGNPNPNALAAQRIVVEFQDGTRLERHVAATPGAVFDAAAKLALARNLAIAADARLFDDPFAWATAP